jgi:uncharacterized membrane protein
MDPKNYVKWQAIVVGVTGILVVAFGIALFVTTTHLVGGVCLTLIGFAGVATGVWAFKRGR